MAPIFWQPTQTKTRREEERRKESSKKDSTLERNPACPPPRTATIPATRPPPKTNTSAPPPKCHPHRPPLTIPHPRCTHSVTATSDHCSTHTANILGCWLQQKDAQKCTSQTLEDKTKSTGAHPQLLRWALSVPGLNEPVDLTVDLRAQPPET